MHSDLILNNAFTAMRLKLSITIAFLCFLLVGCSFMPNELKLAERVIETSPDSALHILQRMKSAHLMSDGDRALFGLLYFQALDKNKLPLKPDSLIDFSLKYYSNKGDNPHLASSYFYKARLLKSSQKYDDATLLYLRALDIVQGKKDYILLGKIYSDMGDICMIQKDYNEAKKKFQLSIDYFNKAGDSVEASYRVISIGKVYHFLKDFKKAHLYYQQALSQTPDSLLHGFAYQEIGVNYYWAKQYDSAQYFLRKSLSFPYKGNNYAIRCFNLADLFFDREQYDSAFQYANLALKYPASFFIQRDCYRILSNTEFNRGNLKQMAFFISKYQDCTDSVRKVEIQTKSTVLENLYQTNDKVSKTKHYLFLLASIITLVLGLSFFIVNRLRKRNKGKEKELEQVEEKLNEKQLLLKDSLIQKLEEARKLNAALYKKSSLKERESLDKELYNNCLHVNDWDVFKKVMNKTFNNIINNLENKCDDINHKEMIWCCLYLLDISTPDIALILDTQPGSLYKLKQRITQKMNLTNTKEFNQLLKDMSEGK
jgi:tetratricopeptide (TPR) repeat protein